MENSSGFDIEATRRWVTGVLTDPNGTARAYEEAKAPWRRTFLHITLPVMIGAAVVGLLLSWIFGRAYFYGGAGGPVMTLLLLAWQVASVFVVVFIFDFFAGVFKGTRSYDAAFAALSLAMVPAALGGVLGPLPWIGWLISLAAGVYGLVLAYRFIGVFMAVPDDQRVLHFVVSLLVAFVANIAVSALFALMFVGTAGYGGMDVDDTSPAAGGLFGGLERQANLADQAAQDVYNAPADGLLTDAQVASYARTLERTAQLRERLGKRFDGMKDSGDAGDDSPSLGDIFSSVGDAARLGTAEMEVVKTGGGNWAEHQWVRNQIEVARVQQDSSPAVQHNYALFLKYQDAIEKFD